MYAWIEGRLEHAEPDYVVLTTHGVGYMLTIPIRLFADLPPLGQVLRLYTSFQVRENHQALYGFKTDTERRCFETLLRVTGVGPKVALSILGVLTPQALYTAVYQEDVKTLCMVPGIGKKSAERLLMEMKDRSQQELSASAETAALVPAFLPKSDPLTRDARDALVHLGYSVATAEAAVHAAMKQLPAPVSLSLLITQALKEMR